MSISNERLVAVVAIGVFFLFICMGIGVLRMDKDLKGGVMPKIIEIEYKLNEGIKIRINIKTKGKQLRLLMSSKELMQANVFPAEHCL